MLGISMIWLAALDRRICIGLAFAWLIIPASTLMARELTGILYANHSGPSGSGTGEIRIKTQNKMVMLAYQKPLAGRFARSCWEPGSIWTVLTRRTEDRDEVVDEVSCPGKIDITLHEAWTLVRDFMNSVTGESHLEFKSPRGAFDSRDLDWSGYRNFGGDGLCLEIMGYVGHEDENLVIRAPIDCALGKIVDFALHKTQRSGWRINSIEVQAEK
jgi:hypothetical protein